MHAKNKLAPHCFKLNSCLDLYMDALIVYPENKKQLTALKVVMKAMKVAFEQRSQPYPDHVINGVNESLSQSLNEDIVPYTGIQDMLKSK